MVEINNQRKAFLDMLAWSEGTDNEDVRKPEIMVMTSLWAESYLLIMNHPRKLAPAKPKTQINRRRTLSGFFPVETGCLPQAAWPERLLRKSPDAVALQQIKERGALPMIKSVVISSGNRPLLRIIWASLPGAGYGQFEHKADSLIAKFKEAGGTVRRD